jgi:hypothetical protein
MSPVNIHGSEYPIKKVFCNDFVFTVPLYQRPYAWTTEHAGELLEDLMAFMGDSNEPVEEVDPYFLGSVVLIKKGDSPKARIIDGQQRLTTLAILLSTLRASVEPEFGDGLTDFLYEKGTLVTDTPDRYRLTLRERDAEFFQEYIQSPDGTDKLKDLDPAQFPDSQKKVRENALLFLDRLRELSEGQRQRLAKFIVNRCYLVIVSTPDLDSAYRIFSVLNDRGLDLSHTDILKAEIIGKIPEAQQETYTKKWEDTEDELGRDAFQDLFSHIRMIHRKVKLRGTVLKEFRQYVAPTDNPQQFIDEALLPYADAFDTIRSAAYQSDKHAEGVNNLFGWLNRIDNFDWVPPAILYFSQNHNSPEKLVSFFTDLERLAAGLMIRRANINKRIERYGRLLAAIERGKDLYVADSPLQLTPEERNEILEILDGDLYLIPAIRLYVLLRLDAALSEGEASYSFPIITVEHVLPQKPASDSKWVRRFPNQEESERYVHRLGNLVLLSRRKNSQAQNYNFELKKQKYFATEKGVSPFALTTQVLQEQEWTPEVIERRQEELIGILRKVWRL